MPNTLTEREYSSIIDTGKRTQDMVHTMNSSLQDFIVSQTGINATNKAEIESTKKFKLRVIQVFMAFLVSSASIAAKYTFEDNPIIEVKTEKKAGG